MKKSLLKLAYIGCTFFAIFLLFNACDKQETTTPIFQTNNSSDFVVHNGDEVTPTVFATLFGNENTAGKTTAFCGTPPNLAVSVDANNLAVATWGVIPNANLYGLQVRVNSNNIKLFTTTSTNLSGTINPDASYEIRIIARCMADELSAWSAWIPITVGQSNSCLSAVTALFSSNVNIYTSGNNTVFETDDIPDHGSPYFPTNDPRYEAYNGNNPAWNQNPNNISAQNYTLTIPSCPEEAANHANTNLGAIGIARNGVVLFNQYAGPNNQPLTNEINSFDQYNGHPAPQNNYHYHIEPLYLTTLYGKDAFLGILLDGFPVYGPEENGQTITNGDLDQFHGHFGPTPEFPNGIYHYHITAEDPYMNGGQYYGTAGTVSN